MIYANFFSFSLMVFYLQLTVLFCCAEIFMTSEEQYTAHITDSFPVQAGVVRIFTLYCMTSVDGLIFTNCAGVGVGGNPVDWIV